MSSNCSALQTPWNLLRRRVWMLDGWEMQEKVSAWQFYANENNGDKHYKRLTLSKCLFDVLMQEWDTCNLFMQILSVILNPESFCQLKPLSCKKNFILKSLSKLFASIAKSEARSGSFAFFPSPPLWLQGISHHIIFFPSQKKKFVIVSSGMNSFSLQFLAISNFINLLSGSWRKGHCRSVGVRAVTVSSWKLFEVSE